jgi:hypothetical protein
MDLDISADGTQGVGEANTTQYLRMYTVIKILISECLFSNSETIRNESWINS